MKSGREECGWMQIRLINSDDKSGSSVTNVIHVSVTDSFRGSYSEQGVDTPTTTTVINAENMICVIVMLH